MLRFLSYYLPFFLLLPLLLASHSLPSSSWSSHFTLPVSFYTLLLYASRFNSYIFHTFLYRLHSFSFFPPLVPFSFVSSLLRLRVVLVDRGRGEGGPMDRRRFHLPRPFSIVTSSHLLLPLPHLPSPPSFPYSVALSFGHPPPFSPLPLPRRVPFLPS